MTAPHSLRGLTSQLVVVVGLLATGVVWADSERRLMPAVVPKAYAQECAACHLAYAPSLLSAGSWRRLMGGLDKHFDTDASLDAATLQQLSGWLQTNAGSGKRVDPTPPQDRITRSAWFERKHRQVDPVVWLLPSVRGKAQCAACHTGADKGDFDDDRLRLPAGLSPAQRRAWRH